MKKKNYKKWKFKSSDISKNFAVEEPTKIKKSLSDQGFGEILSQIDGEEIRHCYAYEFPNIDSSTQESGHWPGAICGICSITKQHQAGLKLKPAPDKWFLEIEYKPRIPFLKRSVLEIPRFDIDDTTEFVVRNLMALEQCHYPYDSNVCNYIRLWDFFIHTAEDVDLLAKEKIIVNGLGDSATLAELVNKLCNQIAEVNSCYYVLATQLDGYYDNIFNYTMATLRSVYFGDLWRGTGTAATVVLLVLTLIQTVFAIIKP